MKKIIFSMLAFFPLLAVAQGVTAVAEKVADGVYKIIINDNVNSTAVIFPSGVTLFDSGLEGTQEALCAAVGTFTDAKIVKVINTHFHFDHTGGNAFFIKNGVDVYATDYTIKNTAQKNKANKVLSSEKYRICHGAHTGEDLQFIMADKKVAIVGDLLFADRFPYVDVDNGGNVIKYLEEQKALIKVLPAGAKIIGGHGRVYSVEEYKKMNDVLYETVDIVNQLIMADESLESIQKADPLKDYSKYDWAFVNRSKWIELIYKSLR